MVCWDVACICYVCVWHDSRKWYVMLFNILCAIDDEISETNFFWQKGNQAGQCQIWQFIWTLLTLVSCFFQLLLGCLSAAILYASKSGQLKAKTLFDLRLLHGTGWSEKGWSKGGSTSRFCLHSQVSLDGWLAGFCRIILTLLYPIYDNLGFVGSTS